MAHILRGEIRWADLNPVRGSEQAGTRPVLVISNDIFNARAGVVIALALPVNPSEPVFRFPLSLSILIFQRNRGLKSARFAPLPWSASGRGYADLHRRSLVRLLRV